MLSSISFSTIHPHWNSAQPIVRYCVKQLRRFWNAISCSNSLDSKSSSSSAVVLAHPAHPYYPDPHLYHFCPLHWHHPPHQQSVLPECLHRITTIISNDNPNFGGRDAPLLKHFIEDFSDVSALWEWGILLTVRVALWHLWSCLERKCAVTQR